MLFFSLGFLLLALWIGYQDFWGHRIPNLALLSLMLMLPWYWSTSPIPLQAFLASGLLGLFLIGILFLFPRLRCMAGVGDIKLFCISCFFTTVYTLPLFMVFSGVFGVGLAFFYKTILSKDRFPLGPALIAGLASGILSTYQK